MGRSAALASISPTVIPRRARNSARSAYAKAPADYALIETRRSFSEGGPGTNFSSRIKWLARTACSGRRAMTKWGEEEKNLSLHLVQIPKPCHLPAVGADNAVDLRGRENLFPLPGAPFAEEILSLVHALEEAALRFLLFQLFK